MAYENYTKVTPGAALVTRDEIKAYLKVDDVSDDSLIDGLIEGWTKWCEEYCWSTFTATTWRLDLDLWAEEIFFKRNPVTAISSIQYYDENDVQQTLLTTSYILFGGMSPSWVEIFEFPDLAVRSDAIQISFTTEQSDAVEGVRNALKALIAQQHWQREDFNPTSPYITLAKRMLMPYRLNYF